MNNTTRRVLILGGSSDIGTEVVQLFLRDNWKVDAHFFKNKKKLNNFKKYSKKLKLIKFNFVNYGNLRNENTIKKKFGKDYDSIINLIGYVDNKSFDNTNFKSILRSLIANTITPILIEKILIKKMLFQKWGRILNCSSIGVKYGGGKNTYNYSFSKHALEFIPSDYRDWAKKNILINNLRIGVTDTKIHNKIRNRKLERRVKLIPIGRMASKKEIAKFIYQLSSQQNTFITGETISIAGGE
jgi:NAD(P)-dependent dehydrogenase (short-subunit alcohol dehydrogenase family)